MIPVVTPAEMAAIDEAAPEPVEVLIDRAGRVVARSAVAMMGGVYGRRVVVVAGPGNNGADGRQAAAILRQRGVRVRVVEPGESGPLKDVDLVIDAAFGTGLRRPYRFPPVGDQVPVLAVDIPSGVRARTSRNRSMSTRSVPMPITPATLPVQRSPDRQETRQRSASALIGRVRRSTTGWSASRSSLKVGSVSNTASRTAEYRLRYP